MLGFMQEPCLWCGRELAEDEVLWSIVSLSGRRAVPVTACSQDHMREIHAAATGRDMLMLALPAAGQRAMMRRWRRYRPNVPPGL